MGGVSPCNPTKRGQLGSYKSTRSLLIRAYIHQKLMFRGIHASRPIPASLGSCKALGPWAHASTKGVAISRNGNQGDSFRKKTLCVVLLGQDPLREHALTGHQQVRAHSKERFATRQ